MSFRSKASQVPALLGAIVAHTSGHLHLLSAAEGLFWVYCVAFNHETHYFAIKVNIKKCLTGILEK